VILKVFNQFTGLIFCKALWVILIRIKICMVLMTRFGGFSMKKFLLTMLLLSAVVLLLAACGGGGDADSGGEDAGGASGNAANGETLYKQATIGSANAPGCITCHSLEPDVVLVGPSHAGLGERAATAVDGMTAEEYLVQSIKEPNAHVTEGYTEGIMYQNYAQDLPNAQINDIVAFLLTQ
jgi:cytochrome c551/c552